MAVATRISDEARGYFIGKYTGTTAAQNIHIGFKPSMIIAFNQTDSDTIYIWTTNSLTAVVALVDAGCSETALSTISAVITQVDNGTVLGFALPGSNGTVNENAKDYVFLALP